MSCTSSSVGRRGGVLGLYIHIPFCVSKCPYCDFTTYQGLLPLLPPYLTALEREVALWGEVLGHPPVDTVYLGGGTPSLLSPGRLTRLLEALRRAFPFAPHAEVTAEANPDDITPEWCAGALAAGVNRLSLGAQSLEDPFLRLLGRRHTAAQVIAAYRIAREAGFTNVNLDLMFGLPYQTMGHWQDTLRKAVALGPEHLSAYCLTLEEGTPMERWVREGKMPSPDPDLAAEMYEWAEGFLEGEGYRHYEISNWARPGYPSRHNLRYWTGEEYLGVGVGAHSYLKGVRFANLRSPRRYIRAVEREARPFPGWQNLPGWLAVETAEALDPWTRLEEALILGLRLVDGISWTALHRAAPDLDITPLRRVLEEVEALGLVEAGGEGVRLTSRGRLLTNEALVRITAFCQEKRKEEGWTLRAPSPR
jgi:oxygen-independent coproporphyrinogen-3 oxidase